MKPEPRAKMVFNNGQTIEFVEYPGDGKYQGAKDDWIVIDDEEERPPMEAGP
jgi:hypothetical protein